MRTIAFAFKASLVCAVLFFSVEIQGKVPKRPKTDNVNKITPAALMLSDYVSIPSVSGNENEAAYFIAAECRKAGLIVNYINDEPGSVNFSASLYPLSSKKPNIIFHNHIDVVCAGDTSMWTYPPYSGTIADGKVWGRGSFDNKGLGVIQLFTLKNFVDQAYEKDLPYNVTIIFVSGEETGGVTGSKIVAENFVEEFTPVVVVGEGGSGIENTSITGGDSPLFGISIIEKVTLWLKLTWRTDIAGHASIVDDDYALILLINGLYNLINTPMPIILTDEARLMFTHLGNEIGGVKGRVTSRPDSRLFQSFLRNAIKDEPEIRDMVTNKITLTGIGANSTFLNQNSNIEEAYFDCRLLPGTTEKDIVDYIVSKINDTVVSIEVLHSGAFSRSTTPEKHFDVLSRVIKEEFEGAKVVPMLFPASTDNNYYRAHGIPVYGFNPMIVSSDQLKAIHSYDEYITLENINRGIRVFTNFIDEIIKGNN